MRVMILMKASAASEAGTMPSTRLLTEMGAFNDALVKAGVLLAGEGLHPTTRAARVAFSATAAPSVSHGPFPLTGDLLAGFWLLQVKSLDEAIAWVKRVPNPDGDQHEIEIRQVFEMEDFGVEMTDDLRAQETRQRAELAASTPRS